MRARVQRWGDSLALRIPPDVASSVQIGVGSEVEISLEGTRLVISPVARKTASLDKVLAGITEENRHGEWDTGPPIRREVSSQRG